MRIAVHSKGVGVPTPARDVEVRRGDAAHCHRASHLQGGGDSLALPEAPRIPALVLPDRAKELPQEATTSESDVTHPSTNPDKRLHLTRVMKNLCAFDF
eukprot:gene26171-biopygen2658